MTLLKPFSAGFATFFLLLAAPGASLAELILSEFMAVNNRTLADEDGASSDWIELRNTGPGSIDTDGYYLTDDANNLTKWRLPSRALAADGFVVVFASGKDRSPAVGELHTSFSLNANGEYLALVAPNGATIQTDFNPFPEQFEDASYGSSRPVQTIKPVSAGASAKWRVPTTTINGWQSRVYSDSSWTFSTTGIGYDRSDEYTPYFGSNGNVESVMYNINGSVYLRVPFTLTSIANIVAVRLRIQCDDGFAAYINSTTLLASDLAPATPLWNSIATTSVGKAAEFREFPLSSSTLLAGSNILAIQGLNGALNSSDLLLTPELEIDYLNPAAPATIGYMPDPTPNLINRNTFDGFVNDTNFSVKRGFYDAPVSVAITSTTEGATIRYTTNNTEPTETNGTVYTSPVSITNTTVLRAAAFKTGFVPTNIDTNTYLFSANVISQPVTIPGFSSTWGNEYNYSLGAFTTEVVPADYQMDPTVTANPAYSGIIKQALDSTLPALCITGETSDIFSTNGIYGNARLGATELPISMEYFEPNSTEQFQQNAGIRIHGGNARSHPKKPFRLYFKRQYGKGNLNFPLFTGSAVKSFDQLILRPGGHDGWSVPFGNESTDLAPHALYMRDQFMRRTETDMGILSPQGKYVHFYINGLYWGVYDLHERVNAQYFAAHRGGIETDWDVYHHRSLTTENFALVDGTDEAYTNLQTIASGGINNAGTYEAIQEYLDLDTYIDAMISRMWSGDFDWDGDQFLKNDSGTLEADVSYFTNKNWYGGRKTRNGAGKFFFFSWDAEMSMGNHLMVNLGIAGNPQWLADPPPQRQTRFDSTRVNTLWAPAFPYSALRSYPPFQRKFGDRLQKHFFGDGALSAASTITRATNMEAILQLPIIAESARWGDVNENNPVAITMTRDTHWQPEVDWWKNTFLTQRTDIVLEQFRAIGLYPDVTAAQFSLNSGAVNVGTQVTLIAPSGQIYYTTDGSDPLTDGEFNTVNLIAENSDVRAFIPSVANGGSTLSDTWKGNLAFDDSAWLSGTQGVGYETSGSNYAPFFNVNVVGMQNNVTSAYTRIPFAIFDQASINRLDQLFLNLRYDDGFVAYLNGVEVARSNAPVGSPAWDAEASANNLDTNAESYETFEVTVNTPANLLTLGANVLAIQMLNRGLTSSDILLQAKLDGREIITPAGASPAAQLYTGPITLTSTQTIRTRVLNTATGEWSALSEEQYLVGTLASAANLVISEMNYRPREPHATAETSISTNRDDYEWIEVMNPSAGPVDITNMKFTQGVTFTFSDPEILQPGEKKIVVRNRAAFLARYGAAMDPEIAGEFQNGTGLSNGGEQITLTDALNQLIHTFTYNDSAPWPASANDGQSLTLLDPSSIPDHSVPANWTASMDAGGTPGSFQITSYQKWSAVYFDPAIPNFVTLSAPENDYDSDGLPNILEYALATDPTTDGTQPTQEAKLTPGPGGLYLSTTYRQRPQNDDFVCTAESSATAQTWSSATTETGTASENSDGSVSRSFRTNAAVTSNPHQLIRIRATQVEP
jgi:hypothetical protein